MDGEVLAGSDRVRGASPRRMLDLSTGVRGADTAGTIDMTFPPRSPVASGRGAAARLSQAPISTAFRCEHMQRPERGEPAGHAPNDET